MLDRTVLIIAYYFPPMGLSGVQRIVKFIKYLPEYGWKPIVLTESPTSFYAFDETLMKDLENPEIMIFRTPPKKPGREKAKTIKLRSYFIQTIGRKFLQTIYQPDSKAKWQNRALAIGSNILKKHKVDVILATAPPYTDFLVARELSRKFNIPYIVDYRDPWVDNPFNFYATPIHKSNAIKLERDILTHTEKAIVVSRHIKELLVKRYGFISHNDVMIIPHGFDPDDFEGFKDVKPNPNKFTITHAGVFQDNRTPKYFFQALSDFLKKRPEAAKTLEARFIGIMRKSHNKMIKKYGLTNNTVSTGYISHHDNIKHLMESDVLWFMLRDLARSPGKLYEYFGAEKPILACVPDGVMRKLALDTKAAIATAPDDVYAIGQAIETFYNLWKNNNLPKPNAEFIEQFNRRKLAGDLAKELELAAEL